MRSHGSASSHQTVSSTRAFWRARGVSPGGRNSLCSGGVSPRLAMSSAESFPERRLPGFDHELNHTILHRPEEGGNNFPPPGAPSPFRGYFASTVVLRAIFSTALRVSGAGCSSPLAQSSRVVVRHGLSGFSDWPGGSRLRAESTSSSGTYCVYDWAACDLIVLPSTQVRAGTLRSPEGSSEPKPSRLSK